MYIPPHMPVCDADSKSHHKMLYLLTTVLIPVALLLGGVTGGFVIWRRHSRLQKATFVTQPSMDASDSTQGTTLQMATANLLESKALTGSMMMSSDQSFSRQLSSPDLQCSRARHTSSMD